MYCERCGNIIPGNSRFCQYCREPVRTRELHAIDYILRISHRESQQGVVKRIKLANKKEELCIKIPIQIQDGQIIVLRKVNFTDSSGRFSSRDVYLRVVVE